MSSPITFIDPGSLANVVGDSVTVAVPATDLTDGTPFYTAAGLPNGLSISSSTGTITGTITSTAATIGAFETTITANDGSFSASDTFSWTVVAAGSVTLATPSNQSNVEGGTISTLSLSASGSGTLK